MPIFKVLRSQAAMVSLFTVHLLLTLKQHLID